MEKKKNNLVLIILVIVLSISVLGLGGFIVYDKLLSNKKANSTPTTKNTTTTKTTTKKETDNNTKSNEVIINVQDYLTENNKNYMDVDYDFLAKYTKEKYIMDFKFNVKLNNKMHSIKLKNYDSNDYDCDKGKDKVLYFDDKVIHEPQSEGCYLSGLSKIIILDNKYLVLHYSSQNGGTVFIYDEDGKEITFNENVTVSFISNIEKDYIIYEGSEIKDENCIGNKYKLEIIDNKIVNTLLEKGTESICI